MSRPTVDQLLAQFERERGAPLPPATREVARRIGAYILAAPDREVDAFLARLATLATGGTR